ncbi:5-formyltetrahydrofolate cyclo-ligase [Luteimonas deserti]|uniref:5-formyltetrahydrofolate cyclo-ligase n=1 Tax=Luteimonas deserti TaxID=2752306 RepID=A0A7Z0QS22_9GAMM|nr:5-formyltetrahydrofolate cyclo-ligase [Luteimonas deserti]NYZ62807.1 5-formyltetrahydrofolate cyclo-ligase [Luteimonas deserti]
MTDRIDLRRRLRAQRRETPAGARIAAADGLARELLALPLLPTRGYVAGYWAGDGEIGLHVFQLRLPAGLVYCLPILHGDILHFAPWRAGDPLVTNRYGIPEPDVEPASALTAVDMALVVTPLVGFDRHGQRLGMGGGWYDRTFAFRRTSSPPPLLVGAAFASQETTLPPPAHWDVPLDAICTESDTVIPTARP